MLSLNDHETRLFSYNDSTGSLSMMKKNRLSKAVAMVGSGKHCCCYYCCCCCLSVVLSSMLLLLLLLLLYMVELVLVMEERVVGLTRQTE